MKFNIKISKWGVFYFFIQNLSEWHFSNRKDYNVVWREEMDTFSEQEEDALKKFRKIRSKYPQSKSCFEKIFFLSEKPFEELLLSLPEEDCQTIKNIFSLFEDKFNTLYKKDLSLLNDWQETLGKISNDQELVRTITTFLNVLYRTSVQKRDVNVFILFSTSTHTGGGANIDDQSISVEISRYPLENVGYVLGIVWHEIIHFIFQNQYFYPLLVKLFLEDQQKVDFINEITTASLFPKGMLGIRLLKNKPAARLASDISAEQTIEILNLTKEYLDKNKSFDRDYLKKLSLIIKRA